MELADMTDDDMTDDDYDALSQKQLASIKRDTRISFEDAAVRATHKVMAELQPEVLTGESIERFAELVRADEREKSLKLWMLLDDIDTADDIAKTDHDTYRRLCHNIQQKRWAVLNESEVDAAIRARGNT
jgi:hypothetical protein